MFSLVGSITIKQVDLCVFVFFLRVYIYLVNVLGTKGLVVALPI